MSPAGLTRLSQSMAAGQCGRSNKDGWGKLVRAVRRAGCTFGRFFLIFQDTHDTVAVRVSPTIASRGASRQRLFVFGGFGQNTQLAHRDNLNREVKRHPTLLHPRLELLRLRS